MNKLHIKEAWAKVALNFMTPEVLDYEIAGNRVVELSQGTGIDGEDIYGVSEFIYDGHTFDKTRRCQLHHGKTSARKYYQKLVSSLPEDTEVA